MSTFTPAQLDQGRAAILTMTRHYAEYQTMPLNIRELMALPVEIVNPKTGSSRVVRIGEMTAQDMSDWATNEEAAARDDYLASFTTEESL